ncbi:Intermediate filament-like protein, sorting nexins, and related proteins containing PX (PhoX) domain(s) [Phaffia rhodozyma]|uniref:Intermediate filament-like protein, sorting nexins, and related proteins containing PX (PhoX) domain(S) n=1 Tax=Phaffia rhodozyma TaxID=264483 RepID=A0A0F7SL34_PHARH|nr:Intermediate filament-like protein, sorting nexins, and related proteins containing PX (PhoX) domain(s) [Phaffia rhodozyma]
MPSTYSQDSKLTRITSTESDQTNFSSEFTDAPMLYDLVPPPPPSASLLSTSRSTPGHVEIRIVDNTVNERLPFAQSVSIPSYNIVGQTKNPVRGKSGTESPVGSAECWVVYEIEIRSIRGGVVVRESKRYSEFCELRESLKQRFPHLRGTIPKLPSKSPLHKFKPSFLETRRLRLQEWLSVILLHSEMGSSDLIRDWLLST